MFPEQKQENILDYLQYLVKVRHYNASSLNLAKYALIYYFKEVLQQKIIVYIPTIKRARTLPIVIDNQIILQLIDVTKNLKHKIVIELLYSSGVRLGEIIKLKWEDFDFENKLIRINNGKGNKDRISILSQRVIDDLKKYKTERYNQQNPYVLDSLQRPNTYLSKKTIQKILDNARKKLGLKYKISPHRLRNSLATHLVEKDVNLRKIQTLLGHSNLNTTQIYTRVAKNDLINIQNPLDDASKVEIKERVD